MGTAGDIQKRLLAAFIAVVASTVLAAGQPTGGNVVGGSATISGAGTNSVIVNQSSSRAIINWNTFNIGTGGSATFNQPGSSSIVLNRVTGGLGPSMIDGTLTANGRVFIINRDGMLFGRNAVINTSGFLATTHDIRDADFMAGRMNFNISGRPDVSIVNLGRITATSHGFAALVAPGVRNSGTITANLGTVALASGNGFTLDMYGDRLIQLGVGDEIATSVRDVQTGQTLKSLVTNEGKLRANGGRVEITAAAARKIVDSVINNKGVIEANSVGTRAGKIVLGGATKTAGLPKQTIQISGTISAAGKKKGTKGGTIQITGEDIQFAAALLDASGRAGGGKILVGGDYGGGRPLPSGINNASAVLEAFAIPTAATVTVDGATTFNASATDTGDGGKVILWSDVLTTFAGTIAARGGVQSGDGGFVEVSGKQQLSFDGIVDTRAPHGRIGSLLLDPLNATIDTNAGSGVITIASLESALASADVIVTTAGTSGAEPGDITVAAAVNWSSTNSLTLSATRNILINADLTNTGGAAVVLRADNEGTGIGTVTFAAGKQISTAGPVSIFYNPSVNPAGSLVNTTSYVSPTENFSANVTGGGALTAYMLVNTVNDLQNIKNNLTGTYALGRDIDASDTATWNAGLGFLPLGGDTGGVHNFFGRFDGQGYIIDGLTIRTDQIYVGLFGNIRSTAIVENFGLTNVSISGTGGFINPRAGGIAGQNEGTIRNVFITGSVSLVGGFVGPAGGLVGTNSGTISDSYSLASVSTSGSTNNSVGGLVGENGGGSATIIRSYAAGPVTASGPGAINASIGGMVGVNQPSGSVVDSYGTGPVSHSLTGSPNIAMDALIARNFGTVTNSQALTTAELKAALPAGFQPSVWAISPSVNNGYPHLKWQTATKPPLNTTVLRPNALQLITVTVDPLSIIYGQNDPQFIPQIVSGGLLGTDTFSGSPTRTPGTNVGSYTIGQGTLSLPANYTLTFLASTLIINPAPLTIRANDTTRQQGLNNPAFTATYIGLVGGDTPNVVSGLTFSPTTTVNFNQGSYSNAIIPSGASAQNYTISYVPGTLTIAPHFSLPSDIFGTGQTRSFRPTSDWTVAHTTVLTRGPLTLAESIIQDAALAVVTTGVCGAAPPCIAFVTAHAAELALIKYNWSIWNLVVTLSRGDMQEARQELIRRIATEIIEEIILRRLPIP